MNRRIALYPGSFDPPTLGHMDMIRRAASMFDELVVAVIRNPSKQGTFSMEERLQMLQRCVQDLPNVSVDCFEGVTVRYARQIGASVMIRGLRSTNDFDMEQQLAQVNQRLAPDIETIFLMCRPEHSVVSSSNVRELASYGCSISGYVMDEIAPDIFRHYQK